MTAHTHTSHLEFEELAEIELLPVLTRVTDRTDEAEKKAGRCFSLAEQRSPNVEAGEKNNAYMCVPISFTSWWMTSSMQQSGLSSATAELDADRLSLWELV